MALALVAVTLATFASPWWGHDRGLSITRGGRADELLLDSCCHRVVAVRFRLSHPRGTPRDAYATAEITYVHVFDRSQFSRRYPAPHVGERATLHLHDGRLDEPFTRIDYCRPARSGCGA
jgi:hypothetical protein